MIAQEMFKNLGLELYEKAPKNVIWYVTENYNRHNGAYWRIVFHIFDQTYTIWSDQKCIDYEVHIDTKIHEAIHQQLIELGWIKK